MKNNNNLNFLYCQKLVILSKDKTKVLLARRQGEADYDGVYTFIGGKMENADKSIIDGIKREKDEEVGKNFKIKLYPTFTTNTYYVKKDGSPMILPNYLAVHHSGDIELNDEYSDCLWVDLNKVEHLKPIIETIPSVIKTLLRLEKIAQDSEFIII